VRQEKKEWKEGSVAEAGVPGEGNSGGTLLDSFGDEGVGRASGQIKWKQNRQDRGAGFDIHMSEPPGVVQTT